jgi:probable rRNA maturation factor
MSDFPFSMGRRRALYGDGTPEVFVADEQTDVAVDVARWSRLAVRVLDAQGVHGNVELAVLFVDERAIAELNQRFLGGEGPTDVLAFPIDEDLFEIGRSPDAGSTGPDRSSEDVAEAPLLLGDVVVCPAVAAHQASERGVAVDHELALLVVHGILHVLGMDHADEEEAAVMQARERELLADCGEGGAVSPALEPPEPPP